MDMGGDNDKYCRVLRGSTIRKVPVFSFFRLGR
jgi:hypothetical protein